MHRNTCAFYKMEITGDDVIWTPTSTENADDSTREQYHVRRCSEYNPMDISSYTTKEYVLRQIAKQSPILSSPKTTETISPKISPRIAETVPTSLYSDDVEESCCFSWKCPWK